MSRTPEEPRLDSRHDLVGGAPEILGPWQLALLARLGLRPEHSLLDLGCGTLRGGLHFIEYLVAGRYTGVDRRADLLAIGRELLERAGLEERMPELLTLEEWEGRRHFDWVLTQSVLNHLGEAELLRTVDRVSESLAAHGRWIFTIVFDPTARTVRHGEPHSHREGEYRCSRVNPHWFLGVLRRRKISFAPVPDGAHPRGLNVFMARRSGAGRA